MASSEKSTMGNKSLGAVYASQVFQKLLEVSGDRLQKAIALRAAMMKQLREGIAPSGYRADFLNETAREVIHLLCAAAEKFNAAHLDDVCTTADFLDCLATARHKILVAVPQVNAMMAVDPKPGTES